MVVYITWNMQGAGGGAKDNLWTNKVFFSPLGDIPGAPAQADFADVICLQECGIVPARYQRIADGWARPPVECYALRRGSAGRGEGYFLSYYPWDDGAHRVNLGTITRERPVDAFLSRGNQYRPILYVVPAGPRGSTLIANIHAGRGGFDTNELLDIASETGARYQCVYILGDFNRDANGDVMQYPVVPYQYHPIYPPGPTHKNGRTLDFMVEKGRVPQGIFCQVLSNDGLSDHFPVLFMM